MLQTIEYCTNALSASFTGLGLFASLGNHDFYPTDQANVSMPLYASVAQLWLASGFLPQDQVELFGQGGYYAKRLNAQYDVLSLNTILWYAANKAALSLGPDPVGQFAWLQKALKELRSARRRALIIGHVPPGFWETDGQHYHDAFNEKFLSIVEEYHDVIGAMFYGHEHSDNIRLLASASSDSVVPVPIYLAPAVTPWTFDLTSAYPPTNNPSIRVYHAPLDGNATVSHYSQVYAPLEEANAVGELSWKVLYDSLGAYGTSDLSRVALAIATESTATGATLAAQNSSGSSGDIETAYGKTFARYWSYNLAGVYPVSGNGTRPCDLACFGLNLCAMAALRSAQHDTCLKDPQGFVKKIFTARQAKARRRDYLIGIGTIIAINSSKGQGTKSNPAKRMKR